MGVQSMGLDDIIARWRPGSQGDDWSWAHEWACMMVDPKTSAIWEMVEREGIGFADAFHPILLGNDGRVWDGHHRICIALQRGIESVMVEVVE